MHPIQITSPTDFGQIIRDRRRALSISQEELSALTGVNQSNLSRIENGTVPAKVETCLRLFAALGIDLVAEPRT